MRHVDFDIPECDIIASTMEHSLRHRDRERVLTLPLSLVDDPCVSAYLDTRLRIVRRVRQETIAPETAERSPSVRSEPAAKAELQRKPEFGVRQNPMTIAHAIPYI
ncbi:hypothetical protein [Lysobacter hankyongensis]|uniref:Uncharacterized protein n=1 Tax=Lysobacter hankyongensis TaxID=1176535 RepID=A0ABP9C0D1_9GAMM